MPRIDVADCKREELQRAGVYFLLCGGSDGEEKGVYIGESDNVKTRLTQHIQKFNAGEETYFRHTVICFTGPALNKALVRYLEHRAVRLAEAAKKYKMLTKNTFTNDVISEPDAAAMDEFLDNMKVVLGALGCDALEPYQTRRAKPEPAPEPETAPEEPGDLHFYLTTKNVSAEADMTAQGFVLCAGAKINEHTTKSLPESAARKRREMMESEKVSGLTTTQDILFSSPTAAAIFVLGSTASGPQLWKDSSGTALKDREDI